NFFGDLLTLHFGVAVEDDVAEIGEQLGGAVAATWKAKKLGRLVKERRCNLSGAKLRMIDDVFDEGNIRLHAADSEFAKGAVHSLATFGKRSEERRVGKECRERW